MHEIGEDVTEQLDIIPATVKVLRHARVKYGRRGCESWVTAASMPKQPIPKSFASPATLAHVAVANYADHLPLCRQEELWERLGVTLNRGTLASCMIRCGELVRPLINLMRDDMITDGVVHCDESTIQVLDKIERGKQSTSTGYMWVLSCAGPGPRSHIFTYDPARLGKVVANLMDGFQGVVVTDGLSGYHRLSSLGMTSAGCWTYARRKCFEATEKESDASRTGVAHKMLRQCNRLAAVEKIIAASDSKRRAEIRTRISKRIAKRVESILDRWIGVVPPRTETGIALNYLRSEWEGLQVFLRDERVPLDKNCVENNSLRNGPAPLVAN